MTVSKKLKEIFPISYYVNLDSRIDRKGSVEKEFAKIGYVSTRHSARKEVTTTISHLEILKKALDLKENILIFEDDAEFLDDDLQYLDVILNELSNIEWDMFYLGGNLLRPAFQTSEHLARLSHCYSAHAYGVNKNFVPILADIVEHNTKQIIDVIYGDYVIPNSRAYISIPMLCIQAESYSDILKRNIDYSIPMQRYEHLLVKDPRFATWQKQESVVNKTI